MPAKRSKGFRSGDLAEQLGLLILQNLALVAPVPRTEDVGIDSVVTLLEDHDSVNLIATDSFFLQIKSKSKKENKVEYKDEEVKWLFSLELPFFIAIVDRETRSLDLFCCHRLSEAYLTQKDKKKVTIDFKDYDQSEHYFTGERVSVGPPVLSLSLDTASDDEVRARFNKLCKSHVYAERINLTLRDVGVIYSLSWTKDKEVEISSALPYKLEMSPSDTAIEELYNQCYPYILALANHSLKNWNSSALKKLVDDLLCIKNTIDGDTKLPFDGKKMMEGGEVYPVGDELKIFNAKGFFSGHK